MSSFKTAVATQYHQATADGLRDLGSEGFSESEYVYTHLETAGGRQYQLVEPMRGHQLALAAHTNNHILVLVRWGENPLAPVSIFATARVIGFYDELHDAIAKTLGNIRPWIQTQNNKYWLVKNP